MAQFEAQLSAQISSGLKDRLRAVRVEDQVAAARISEADIVRAALVLGLPELEKMDQTDRFRLYARINQGSEDSARTEV